MTPSEPDIVEALDSPFGGLGQPDADDGSARLPRAVVHGAGVARIATLPALLDDVTLCRPGAPEPPDLVLAWGRKPSAEAAARWASSRGLPVRYLEDGFLRSLGLGNEDPPLSVVVDDTGIYYDASTPSRLERLVKRAGTPADSARARAVSAQWRETRVSKYNHAREQGQALRPGDVLVADQTFGDASIRHGLADANSFQRMLVAALDEHPTARIVAKVHPDVIAGRKRGHFDRLTAGEAARVTLLATSAHPAGLLEQAGAVYTVTSQLGFEALLWGCPVRVFGMPFYAGWSLTADDLPAPSRRTPATLEALVNAALVRYPRYVHPETGLRCEVEDLLGWMGLQRRQQERFPPVVQAIGFSRWKKPIVRAFFGGSEVRFVRGPRHVPPLATVAVWGRRDVGDLPADTRVVRLEDGFLRSVGLGADLVRPMSWVMDSRSLYYDANRGSDLEHLLQTTLFDAQLLVRAGEIRQHILKLGLTKYNVGSTPWVRPAGTRPVVLVPGQVESDAALALGSPVVRTNLALLKAARALRPDAYLVYKPHPDVVAQLRRRGAHEDQANQHCDEIVIDAPIDALLRQVDEVHVMTSLAGFEALLRGRAVVVHGCPFYAGWGLTTDLQAMPRRDRRLTLDELVAAVLILYPTYVSRVTNRFTTPERTLAELAEWREREGPTRATWTRQAWRGLLRWGRSLTGGPR